MKTPARKMKAIVEAAGGRWHINSFQTSNNCVLGCGDVYETGCKSNNPSPANLNELFRLARKLGHDEIFFASGRGKEFPERCLLESFAPQRKQWEGRSAVSPAGALLNALYESIKEK